MAVETYPVNPPSFLLLSKLSPKCKNNSKQVSIATQTGLEEGTMDEISGVKKQ